MSQQGPAGATRGSKNKAQPAEPAEDSCSTPVQQRAGKAPRLNGSTPEGPVRQHELSQLREENAKLAELLKKATKRIAELEKKQADADASRAGAAGEAATLAADIADLKQQSQRLEAPLASVAEHTVKLGELDAAIKALTAELGAMQTQHACDVQTWDAGQKQTQAKLDQLPRSYAELLGGSARAPAGQPAAAAAAAPLRRGGASLPTEFRLLPADSDGMGMPFKAADADLRQHGLPVVERVLKQLGLGSIPVQDVRCIKAKSLIFFSVTGVNHAAALLTAMRSDAGKAALQGLHWRLGVALSTTEMSNRNALLKQAAEQIDAAKRKAGPGSFLVWTDYYSKVWVATKGARKEPVAELTPPGPPTAPPAASPGAGTSASVGAPAASQ